MFDIFKKGKEKLNIPELKEIALNRHIPLDQWSLMDDEALQQAVHLLETSGLTAKMTNAVGGVLEGGLQKLPAHWNEKINTITREALQKSLHVAISTLDTDQSNTAQNTRSPSNLLHKVGVATSGALGGAFGLSTLAIELPISTTMILRSIADIALSQGEDLHTSATVAACIEVFALGGPSPDDDASESGYFATRLALARVVTEASKHIASKGLVEEGAPALLKLITTVAQRFSIQVSEKAAAQLVPAIGAAGGAIINTLFMSHFQQMAQGHFTIRKLERIYGQEAVQKRYMAHLSYIKAISNK